MSQNYVRSLLHRAIQDPDQWVCEILYVSIAGQQTRRQISPTRFVGSYCVNAICLCREESRNFTINQIKEIKLVLASEALMPSTIEVV